MSDYDSPAFAAAFAADIPPRRFEFSIGGQPAWIEVQRLDGAAMEALPLVGLDYECEVVEGNPSMNVKRVDTTARARYLLGQCLVGWQLWRQVNGDWQQVVPSADPNQRRQQAENLQLTPELRTWILGRIEETIRPLPN